MKLVISYFLTTLRLNRPARLLDDFFNQILLSTIILNTNRGIISRLFRDEIYTLILDPYMTAQSASTKFWSELHASPHYYPYMDKDIPSMEIY